MCTTQVGASLRIKTWNLNLQVAPNNTELNYGRSHTDRAKDIALQILAEDPDVVVLNEANDDSARDVLVRLPFGDDGVGPIEGDVRSWETVSLAYTEGVPELSENPYPACCYPYPSRPGMAGW
jgi:hypothetical protein